MKKRLSYADAVRLLGGDTGWTNLLSKLSVSALSTVPGVGPAITFLNLDDNVQDAVRKAIAVLRRKVTGVSRYKRTELLEAAHAIIVVSALCTALQESGKKITMAFDPDELYAIPGPYDPLWDYYAGLARRMGVKEVPQGTLSLYENTLAKLARDFPEFAFWANRVGFRKILDELSEVHQTAQALLASAATGTVSGKVCADLTTRYQHDVGQPIADTATSASDAAVRLPSLQELYVNPSYRELPPCTQSDNAASVTESVWAEVKRCDNLSMRLAEHLVSTQATRAPLVLFGQPGAGKSATTQMLAAGLDPRDFLVVRVELRSVHADAGIQQQIEEALTNMTGRPVNWPDLADASDGAQPVIVLDGFDELLQASGQPHHNYLEQVRDFQNREDSLDRPVVVLVTSRTAVGNQVRYPESTIAIRLEEFDDAQVRRWLTVWNKSNPVNPLSAETALKNDELARQPLLLLMLALFRAEGGALSPGLTRAQLYERLFSTLAERDVAKAHNAISVDKRRRAAQRDLDQLSLVAFAMFNRRLESVTSHELGRDLAALQRTAGGESPDERIIVTRLAGRFFFRLFVQRDQAVRGLYETVSRYEFLHATFGEFLVARWVIARLRRLATRDEELDESPSYDALFRTLLSWTVLSTRERRVLGFAEDLLAEVGQNEQTRLRELLEAMTRDCLIQPPGDSYSGYRPTRQTVPAKYAAYSANLFLLLHVVSGQASSSTLREQQRATRLWFAQLTLVEWRSLVDIFEPHARFTTDPWQPVDDPSDWMRDPSWITPDSPFGTVMREAALLNADGYQGLCTAILPYQQAQGEFWPIPSYQTGPMAAMMMAALLAPVWSMSASARRDLYHVLLTGPTLGLKAARMLLSRLREDLVCFDLPTRTALVELAAEHAWTNINAYLDMCALVPADNLQTRIPISGLENDAYSRDALDILLHELGGPETSRLSGWLTEQRADSLYALIGFADLAGPVELYLAGPVELDLAEPVERWGEGTNDALRLVRIRAVALWAGCAQRGLYLEMPGMMTPEEGQFVYTVAPKFVVALAKRDADALPDLVRGFRKEDELRRDVMGDASVALIGGETLIVTGDTSYEARLALLELDVTAEEYRGKVLRWDDAAQAWRPH